MLKLGGVGRKLKILVPDYGLALEHAIKLADDGHEVYYWTQWSDAFPKFSNYAPGIGYESRGLKKIRYLFDYIDKVDLICFFDIGMGDLGEWLDRNGHVVYGSRNAERIENDRVLLKKLLEKAKLPVQNYKVLKGMPELTEYLKENKNKYVKVNTFRGDVESFHAPSYDKIKQYLDEINVALGPFADNYDFIAEDFVEGVEPGFDCFFTNGEFVKPYLWGIEQSKAAYIGKFVDKMPPALQESADKLTPILAKLDYRGAVSTEYKVTKDGTAYLIDICMRYPYPLSTAYTLAIENYSELIYKVALGEHVEIKPKAKYLGALPLSSKHADNHYVRLDFDEKLSKHIKTRISAKYKGKYYAVKGMDTCYVCIDTNDDYMKIIKHLQSLAKECGGYGVDTDTAAGLDKITEVVKEYSKYGLGNF